MDTLNIIGETVLISVVSAAAGSLLGAHFIKPIYGPGTTDESWGAWIAGFFNPFHMVFQAVVAGVGVFLVLPNFGLVWVAVLGLASGYLVSFLTRNVVGGI